MDSRIDGPCMATRTPVLCEACGRPYSARLIEERIVVSTDDGNCACGSDGFVPIQESPDAGRTANG